MKQEWEPRTLQDHISNAHTVKSGRLFYPNLWKHSLCTLVKKHTSMISLLCSKYSYFGLLSSGIAKQQYFRYSTHHWDYFNNPGWWWR